MGIILASASPRRKQLLSMVTANFSVVKPLGKEVVDTTLPARKIAMLLAKQKAGEVFSKHPDDLVIGADTVVTMEGAILGKPIDRNAARRMLRMLSGRSHRVYTGVCLMAANQKTVFARWTDVTLAPLTEEEISKYVETGECDDKAGAYAVQGLGSRFIEKIDGDYYTVVGLPVQSLYRLLCCGPFTNYLL